MTVTDTITDNEIFILSDKASQNMRSNVNVVIGPFPGGLSM